MGLYSYLCELQENSPTDYNNMKGVGKMTINNLKNRLNSMINNAADNFVGSRFARTLYLPKS